MNCLESYELKSKPKAPWSKYFKEGIMDLREDIGSLYNYFESKALNFGEHKCIDYYGNTIKYNEFIEIIDNCAKCFYNSGIREGDVVTICVSNTVEGVVSFFAANKIGAIANLIHPLSSENEIKDSLKETNSKILVIEDVNFCKIENIILETKVRKVVLVNAGNYMSFESRMKHLSNEKAEIKFLKDSIYIWWKDYISKAEELKTNNYIHEGDKEEPAMILYSGGTTGKSKGVLLSNKNLISYVESLIVGQDYLDKPLMQGDSILALMPIFHGYGIMYSIAFPLCRGMYVILRYKVEAKEYCELIKKYKPQVIAGVTSMYEAVLKEWDNPNFKLDCLKYCSVGGDSLKPALREKVNTFLKQHGADIRIKEAFGLTEAACGVIFEFKIEKENTIGIPLPGLYVGIFSKEDEEVPYGEEGEICVCGPTVMLGYYKNEEETKNALRVHKDGNIWLHTGDLGSMDEDGYITYTSRLKRMIISSGYNVYPNIIEELIESHPAVMKCIVVGVQDQLKGQVPKAYIILNKDFSKSEDLVMEFRKLCTDNLPKYSWPYEYKFMETLPTTKVGKVDFIKLQKDSAEE